MFQKPAFGATTSGFGSFSAGASTSSPFGGFKPATGTGAFNAAPAFGANTSAQPTTGGGLFGATNTTGGLFGATTAPTSTGGFGANTSGFAFGAGTSTGGLFGGTTSTGLFGQPAQNTTAFGAKPAGFGFGSTTTTGATGGNLFGSVPSTGTGLFGQQQNTLGTGSLFSNNTSAFGQPQTATGTGHVKYNPVVGTDVMVKSGNSQSVNIKHHCITCMKEYENKSLEELRLEDYMAGRKGAQPGGMFGGFQQTQAEAKPLFGGSTFGQPATTSAPSVFGGGGLGATAGFGQTSSFSFGGGAQSNTTTTGLFGGNKPAFGATNTTGTGLFGATTTQPLSFGASTTNTPSFGFGANTQNQQTGGLFGAKPATSGFGSTPATGGFGGFGTGGGGLFAPKTSAPTFGTPSFGTGFSGGFGTNTSSTGGLFGANSTFGKPPTSQPTFGFNTQPTLGGGLGAGLGAGAFQAKPAAPAFGALGTTNMFQPAAQNATFKTGLEGGLGGGMFGNTSTLGSSGLGLGTLNSNTNLMGNMGGGASVHEQMLTLAARPYGDSPLFKDLLPDTATKAEDVLKPTNPAAVKAVLDGSNSSAYRVTSPTTTRLKVHPRSALSNDKKSLFDGLEESDPSLDDKLCLKPSRKRLVLRPNQRAAAANDSVEHVSHTNRSIEEPPSREPQRTSPNDKENEGKPRAANDEMDRERRQVDVSGVNGAEASSDRQGSWLSSSKSPWNEKEKSIDNEPTPRIYPNIDKDLPTQTERRASWLTTKPLRKPLVTNPDAVENSVRELGVRRERSRDKENIDTLSDTEDPLESPHSAGERLQFCRHRWGDQAGCSQCEKIAHQIGGLYVSEEEVVLPREVPPHPTGIKLTRPGYYTIPSLDEMISYMRPDGSCVLPNLTIGRKNYGNVYYSTEIDVAGLDLDELVHFLNKEIIVYPEDSEKPPIGEGLNRKAIVTLDRIWPRDKTEKRPITDPDRLMKMDYEGKLRRVCDKHDTKFIEYRPATGSWVFQVQHFSKYGLTDSDEEDEPPPPALRTEQAAEQLQGAAAPVSKPPVTLNPPSLGGLGAPPPGLSSEENLFAMQQTSLNLFNGASKAFEMDTTEDNGESHSLYLDNRAFGVKSPTSELARLEQRRTHNVQLMKASLYAHLDVEDDASMSAGDQLVPVSGSLLSMPSRAPSIMPAEDRDTMDIPQTIDTEEKPMEPLIVRPHTIVLKYHRKVPPFKNTIAGRLGAACAADMSVCRARHSRAGFGAGDTLAFPASYDALDALPKSAEICDLGKYVRGRGPNDWSEPVVVRMSLGQIDTADPMHEILKKHLATLLEHSTCSEAPEGGCPRLRMGSEPRARRALLLRYARDAKAAATRTAAFGVTGAYCYEVWQLCDALWGADLDNDGVPGTDDLSIVNRYRRLLEWLKNAVAGVTDEDLIRANEAEDEDETDGHSARVWTLLLGGRILEACKVAREHGDLNMATLIAQAAGDPVFRSLVARQLSQWRECGADKLISSHRWATLLLIAGISSPRDKLVETDWLRALHATARYICPQVPSLEQIMRTYEELFTAGGGDRDQAAPVDLTLVDNDQMSMKLPLPPYLADYDVTVVNNGKQRRVLDLRYELLRARAYNERPRLRPAAHTPDPFDYSLCFLLGTWFGNPTVESVVGMAEQLEAAGDWHLAVQALAYHPDDTARGHLIRGVISRHAPARADTADLQARLELIRRLRVPDQWLLLAQAHRAKYEHLPAVEAEHLVGARHWNAAHKVLLDELLPEAVLSDDLPSIAPLLEKMNEAARRHEVSGWGSGGQALYHYLHVCDEVRGLVSRASGQRDRAELATRLEALRPTVAAACRALAALRPTSARGLAARAEMGGRLVQLALAGGEPAYRLAALLRALDLPPDCTPAAHTKITTELADRASELCAPSASSSPLSSQHKQAAAS